MMTATRARPGQAARFAHHVNPSPAPRRTALHVKHEGRAVALLQVTDRGLTCEAGGFSVDPWQPVERAVITHAHGDHARPGSRRYLCAARGVAVLRRRLGEDADIEGLPWGEPRTLGDVTVSFHPAGHVLGSAQVRIECRGEVWGISGDYKRQPDPTCEPFEPFACHTFVTEATFALPIYRWPATAGAIEDVETWWARNRDAGRSSVLYAYALGKAQRVLAELGARSDREIVVHGAVEAMNAVYRAAGVAQAPTRTLTEAPRRGARETGVLALAPPSARGTPWTLRFGAHEEGFASGWMRVRGQRRRRSYDRGFVISDHADWPALLDTIAATGASRVLVTHGDGDALVRLLRERGLEADALATAWAAEDDS
jgi:putative mRNA 3-end processing factor